MNMRVQIPHGPEDMRCPIWRKAMSEVCHKCPWWTKVIATNPQTDTQVDEWGCAIAWSPLLGIKNIRQAEIAAVEVNMMRNEASKAHAEQVVMASIAIQRSRDAITEALNSNRLSLPDGSYYAQVSETEKPKQLTAQPNGEGDSHGD